MLLGAVLVVYVLSKDAGEPDLVTLRGAAQEILGDDSEVRVIPSLELESDEAVQRARGADGVIQLRWGDDRATVHLRCYVASEGTWTDRQIEFSKQDEALERGRFLGFAIASMFERPHAEQVAARHPAVSSSPLRRDERQPPARIDALPRRPTTTLEFGAVAATGGLSTFSELGATAAIRFPIYRGFRLRLGASGTAGTVDAIEASSRRAAGTGGLSWSAPVARDRLELGARVGMAGSYLSLSRPGPGGALESRSRWMLSAEGMGEAGLRLGDFAWMTFALGGELALGTTTVFVRDQRVTTLPGLRLRVELGLMTRF